MDLVSAAAKRRSGTPVASRSARRAPSLARERLSKNSPPHGLRTLAGSLLTLVGSLSHPRGFPRSRAFPHWNARAASHPPGLHLAPALERPPLTGTLRLLTGPGLHLAPALERPPLTGTLRLLTGPGLHLAPGRRPAPGLSPALGLSTRATRRAVNIEKSGHLLGAALELIPPSGSILPSGTVSPSGTLSPPGTVSSSGSVSPSGSCLTRAREKS